MDTILDTAPARRHGRCPNFPTVFKRQVVEASYQPGTSVSMIAREHDVNANMVFRWRQQYRVGAFGPVTQSAALLPVEVIEAPIDLPSAATRSEHNTSPTSQTSGGQTFSSGRTVRNGLISIG
jgi:transposase